MGIKGDILVKNVGVGWMCRWSRRFAYGIMVQKPFGKQLFGRLKRE